MVILAKYGTVFPVHQVVFKGSDVNIICNSTTEVKWVRFDWQSYPKKYVINNTLHLVHVRRKDSGLYFCEGTFGNGSVFKSSAEVLVGGIINEILFILLLS